MPGTVRQLLRTRLPRAMKEHGMAAPHPLTMTGISKRFGETTTLDDASSHVGSGEVHALIGQNGACKFAMIKILAGYDRKDRAEVQFAGKPFEVASPRATQDARTSTIYRVSI